MGSTQDRKTTTLDRVLVMLAALAVVIPLFPAAGSAQAAEPDMWLDPGPGVVVNETGEPGPDTYIVLHQAPPLALYDGSVAGLLATATDVTGEPRLDPTTPASVAYLEYLTAEQDALLARIEASIGHSVDPTFRYAAALNGFAVTLTVDEAATVSSLTGVARVERDSDRFLLTDNGPAWIGADAIHDGSATPDAVGTLGEGVVVGVIDTGINADHPSFAAIGPVDGYVHLNPRGTFFGACDPVLGTPFCNNKLVGVYDFTGTSPEDDNGHGSHTASTSAGNVVDVELVAPTNTINRRIAGVAPHANIISYKACVTTPVRGTCPISALIASINQATLDQVDVINFSIGGSSSDPWADLDAQAFFSANAAGIFAATSAGNDGPGAATLGSPADAPWVTSVGASTHDRRLQNGLISMAGGDTTPPADLFGKSNTSGYGPAPIVYAGDYPSALTATPELCGAGTLEAAVSPWPPGTFNGEIVVCDRGEFGRVAKAQHAMEAGAGGFILANDFDNGDSVVADGYAIPGVHISHDDGVILKAWLASGAGHTGTIRGTNADESPDFADSMAGFSSRGPNPAFAGLVKPDVTAPGVDILAAFNTPVLTTGTDEYNIISGTSMSSPHTAGAGALIRAAHPGWSPDEVKSALMTTAFTTVPTDTETHGTFKEDGTTPTDAFDLGAGRIDLRQAALAGFVLDESDADYTAANPGDGGDPTSLNIASFGTSSCSGTCSWTRTISSTLGADVGWTFSFDAPAGVVLSSDQPTITLAAGGEATFTVTADVTAAPTSQWLFGTVSMTPDAAGVPVAKFPLALFVTGTSTTPQTALHMHGNVHDAPCTGDGRADLIACDGPFLSVDPDLDIAPAAKFGPVTPAFNGSNSRNIYDPNWVWHVASPAVIEGEMTVRMWASCGACAAGLLTADWDVKVFDTDAAGATPVFTERVVDATPVAPNTPSLVEFSVQLPRIEIASAMVLQIDPLYLDSQQNTTIYYDSQQPCGAGTDPCDSVVLMPIVSGGPENRAPVASSDSVDVTQGGAVTFDVLANDFDPDGDAISIIGNTDPVHGVLVDNGGGSFSYTHNGGDSLSDSFTYTISDGQLESTGHVTITVVGSTLTVRNSFVSSVGWVKPGEGYPFRVIVENPTTDDATGVVVTVEEPAGTDFLFTTESQGTAVVSGDITWTLGTLPAGATATMVVQAEADTFADDAEIVWKNISSTATLTYDGGPAGLMSMGHGPKVIPVDSTYDSARYGDRPFPVVPVDWFDRKHDPEHTAELLSAKINSPDVVGSTFNLFQEMSLGQLFPMGTVPSAGIASADFSGQTFEFTDPEPQGACTGTTFKDTAGTPVYGERIKDGWYQMPGDTNYYGADRFTFGGSIGGAQLGVGPLLQIDDACGPTGKAVYDAAHIADPEIDYNDFDTDKDGVVDFFMMVFVGLGGNGDSQINGTPPYDNIWPHSSSLEFYYTDPDTGLTGYISNDQLKSLSGVPQCWTSTAYQVSDDCAANGGTGLDSLPVFVRVGPYNVNPEEAIDRASVISHEYGHSLGLPDFYSLGSRDTYGDWNLMATDKSQHMDIFSKQELGWIVPEVLQPGDDISVLGWQDSKIDTGEIHWQTPDGTPYTLSAANGDQKIHNADAWMVKLPSRKVIDEAVVANGASLDHVWWSGSGNDFGCPPLGGHNFDLYLPQLADLGPGDTVEVQFATSFDIEWDYDYGFVLYSTDFGESYQSLGSLEGYTEAVLNPNANACQTQYGNGVTGTTASHDAGTAGVDRGLGNYPANTGFSLDRYDLSAAVGSETVLRFSYATDPGLARPGWFIDDLKVIVNGTDVIYDSNFEDGAGEAAIFNGGCQGERGRVAQTCTPGWKYINASAGSPADHAYYLEMRDRSGFDFNGNGENDRGAISFDPGVLLVYTDENHGYGNVGTDDPPAQTPVDSRPEPTDNTPNLNDAAFKAGDVYFDDGASMLGTQANLDAPAWTDNYENPGPDDPWVHQFGCLGFEVVALSGNTGNSPTAFDLVGDVDMRAGAGCREFDYGNGGGANTAPVAVAEANPTTASVGENVNFSGASSFDAESAPSELTYEWDFGDGSPVATGSGVQHAYGTAGTHTVTLTVTDPGGLSGEDTIDIVVTRNGRPDAKDDDVTTAESTPVDIDVLVDNGHGVDTDPDGDTLTIDSFTQPANGGVTLVDADTVNYSPDAGFVGTDTFSYTITDGELTDTATVTVTVSDVNDDPVGVDDSYGGFEDQVLTVSAPGVLENDFDADGDPLTAELDTSAGGPFNGTVVVNGDGSFEYTPDPNYHGSDQFAYLVRDGNGGEGSATVTLTIASVNDVPVAADDSDTTTVDTAVTVDVLANDSDVDGDALSVSAVTPPANGTVVNNGDGTVTYVPDLGFVGTDTFTYTVSDGNGADDDATVTITVVDDGGTGHTPPVGGGKVTGGGYLDPVSGKKINFGGNAKSHADGSLSGNWTLNDKSVDVKVHITDITAIGGVANECGSITAGVNSIEFWGAGTMNGAAASFRVCVEDNGEPGNSGPSGEPDAFYLECLDGCGYDTASRTDDDLIDGGNIQVHAVESVEVSGEGTSGTGKASGAKVLILDPMLTSEAVIGSNHLFTVLAYDADGNVLEGADVTLSYVTPTGPVSVSGVTGVDGLVSFPATILAGDVAYQAVSGAIVSNYVDITGIE